MAHRRNDIATVGLQAAAERVAGQRRQNEFEPGHELPARARPVNFDGGGRLLFHANVGGPLVIVEDLPQIGGPVPAARIDAVKPVGIFAGVIVISYRSLPQTSARGRLPDGHALLDQFGRFEVLVRQFKVMIPQCDFAGNDLLAFRIR